MISRNRFGDILSVFALVFIPSLLFATQALALTAAHLDYDGCDTCHVLHDAPGGTLTFLPTNTEGLCLACHGPGGISKYEVAVHDPKNFDDENIQGYITCRECHDPHDNKEDNIKTIGYRYDPATGLGQGSQPAIPVSGPAIRVETTTTEAPSREAWYNSTFVTVLFEENPFAENAPHDSRLDFNRRDDDSGICEVCHAAGPASGAATDFADHQWGECSSCHKHEDGFIPHQCVECHDSASTFGLVPVGTPTVLNSALPGKPGSHMILSGSGAGSDYPDKADADWARQWTIRCLQCHAGHGDNSDHDGDGVYGYELDGYVKVANNPDVGIDYQSTGGVFLGGLGAAETSEAETCWGCHGSGRSEWNGQAYNGYSVSTEDWSLAEFDAPDGGSATDVIPTRHVLSIHTANDIDTPAVESDVRSSSVAANVNADGTLKSAEAATLEDVSFIRCSYCHDVHNTFGPDGGVTISSNNPNAPEFTNTYLRGTWLPNAYVGRTAGAAGWTTNMPEVPPWNSGDLYYGSTTGNFTRDGSAIDPDDGNNWGHTYGGNSADRVNVPRLYSSSVYSTYEGGFFIDQNSNWPTSGFLGADEVQETASLCVLCHGAATDSMDYYSGSSLWRTSTNGHSNSTLGGSGTGADIFSGRRDLPDTTEYSMLNQVAVDFQGSGERRWGSDDGYNPPGLPTAARDVLPFGQGFKVLQIDDNNDWAPPFNSGWYGGSAGVKERDTTGDYASWFVSGEVGSHGGTSGRAHDFSCSKCHTPHAAGLPALLITNCLDIDVATWSATGQNDNGDDIVVGPAASDGWARTAAGNCHRKEYWNSTANGNDPANNTGWHRLAPGQ